MTTLNQVSQKLEEYKRKNDRGHLPPGWAKQEILKRLRRIYDAAEGERHENVTPSPSSNQ